MKRVLQIIIILTLATHPLRVHGQPDKTLKLSGSQTHLISGKQETLTGFTVTDNSTLTIKNSNLTLLDSTYEVNKNGTLIITNSTLHWQSIGGIRLKTTSNALINDSHIYIKYTIQNRTYYGNGFGLSEESTIQCKNSELGYLKLTDNAHCDISKTIIGEFGSTSHTECKINETTIHQLILTYEHTWLQINETITYLDTWKTNQIVKTGNTTPPVTFHNVQLTSPPSYQLIDSNFEANNTQVNLLLITGNSGITINNVNTTLLYLVEDVWATIHNSHTETLLCRNGDFNIKINTSTLETMETMMTGGFNLNIQDTAMGTLNLMYAHPDAPNNIKIINTTINNLHLNPHSTSSTESQ